MSERVEEIGENEQLRRFKEYVAQGVEAFHAKATWTDAQAVLAALAQAEREREQAHVCPACGETTIAQDSALVADLRAEVERLKGELNEAKEEVRRQVEMRMLDQGRHHVDLQEASGQIAQESLCSCGETLRELVQDVDTLRRENEQAEAALARVRAALDREHICVMEACCNDAVRAALEGRG